MKYFGKLGYAITTETEPSVWVDEITEKEYYGDVLQYSKRSQPFTDHITDNIEISNELSVVVDPFAVENFIFLKYATWLGHKWKISSVRLEYPRLILTLGGLYTSEEQD